MFLTEIFLNLINQGLPENYFQFIKLLNSNEKWMCLLSVKILMQWQIQFISKKRKRDEHIEARSLFKTIFRHYDVFSCLVVGRLLKTSWDLFQIFWSLIRRSKPSALLCGYDQLPNAFITIQRLLLTITAIKCYLKTRLYRSPCTSVCVQFNIFNVNLDFYLLQHTRPY